MVIQEPADMTAYNNITQAEQDVSKEHRKKYEKSLFYIHQAMHESILPIVAAAITANWAWAPHWGQPIKVWTR